VIVGGGGGGVSGGILKDKPESLGLDHSSSLRGATITPPKPARRPTTSAIKRAGSVGKH